MRCFWSLLACDVVIMATHNAGVCTTMLGSVWQEWVEIYRCP